MIAVKLFETPDGGNKLAYGSITIANMVRINVTLIRTKNGGMFVSFPSYKKQGTEEWVNYVDTVNFDARKAVTEAVIAEYEKISGKSITDAPEDARVERPVNNNPSTTVHQAPQQSAQIPNKAPF